MDIIERKEDGIYRNGALLATYQPTFSALERSAGININQWQYVRTTRGTTESLKYNNDLAAEVISNAISYLGLDSRLWDGLYAIMSSFRDYAPGKVYVCHSYVHIAQRKFKFVTDFYKNSNYTGLITTRTSYSNF